MAIIPNDYEQPSPLQLLTTDVMLLLDDAIEGEEQVSTYELAEDIIALLEEYAKAPKPRIRVPARTSPRFAGSTVLDFKSAVEALRTKTT